MLAFVQLVTAGKMNSIGIKPVIIRVIVFLENSWYLRKTLVNG